MSNQKTLEIIENTEAFYELIDEWGHEWFRAIIDEEYRRGVYLEVEDALAFVEPGTYPNLEALLKVVKARGTDSVIVVEEN